MLRKLYLANATLLVVHEIDSAYWSEWELLHVPGGVTGFLALHVVLVPVVVWGYGEVLAGSRTGLWLSLAVAMAGVFALVVHGWFLLQGRPEFRTTASIAVLIATGLVSVMQAVVVASIWRRRVPRAPTAPSSP
jgi:hypothetical protein